MIDLAEVADPADLAARVQRLAREQNILRVKGHVAVAGKPMRLLLQAVGERVRHQFARPWGSAPRRSQLVVIAEHHDRLQTLSRDRALLADSQQQLRTMLGD